MLSRRQFSPLLPGTLVATGSLAGCTPRDGGAAYRSAVQETWRLAPLQRDQGTALGIRTAHVNMPVEVASLRPKFAEAVGLGRSRPDLVIRFGRGPTLLPSLRRPVQAVLV
jgi:hypothetical protein